MNSISCTSELPHKRVEEQQEYIAFGYQQLAPPQVIQRQEKMVRREGLEPTTR